MKKALNITFIILTILIMAVIFIFSMDTGDESGSKSSRVTRRILSIVIKGFDDMSESEKEALIEKHSFIVRKLAHFSEYAALGFMVFGSFYTSNLTINKKRGVMVILSWLLSTIYASTDELHQMFVAERGPSVRDVMIDSLGALFGVLVFSLIVFLISKYQERKECQ